MKTLFTTIMSTLIAIAFVATSHAQFDNPTTPAVSPPVTTFQPPSTTPTQPAKVISKAFTDLGNGTFKNNQSGLIWMSDPTKIPVFQTENEAKAWLANLKSGQMGLNDRSKAGDWRIPTNAEWDTAATRAGMDPMLRIGWSTGHRGYIGIGTKGDRWGGQWNMSVWSDGGRDSGRIGGVNGRIWPVRSNSAANEDFTNQGNGTFKHNKTGLVWLADPTNVPDLKSWEEAKTWLANVQSGNLGLNDNSKPGDWRLPTKEEWNSAYDRKNRGLYRIFYIGWPKKNSRGAPDGYTRGYVDNSGLATWGDGGKDAVALGGRVRIWPVRSGSTVAVSTNANAAKDVYDYDGGRMVFNLNMPLKDNAAAGYVAYSKALALGENTSTKVVLSVSVSTSENYYTFELMTPGSEGFDAGGVGNRMSILASNDDWCLRRHAQTIYATGTGMEAALKDLQSKLNGVDGRLAVSGSGDAAKGTAVVTIQRK